VVRLLLVVGGLFVLGILCGGRANAAEGATTSVAVGTSAPAARPGDTGRVETTGVVDDVVTSAGGQLVKTVTADAVRPVTRDAVRPVTREVVRPVTRVVVRPVAQHVVRPVGRDVVHAGTVVDEVLRPVTEDVLRPVVEAVAGRPGDASSFPPEAQMPSWPEGSGWPGGPEWPDVPELPQLPRVPTWPTLPGETLPVEVTPREPGAVRPDEADHGVDGGRERYVGPVRVVHGPFAGDGDVAAVAAPHRDAGAGDVRVGRTVEPQVPGGVPTGALGGHSAIDNGGPRHAEPHAVTSLHRAPLSLAPGATAADVADGTRERHRDIPEFPG
jgi:hypothetical protein